jgi:hypothetical protein
MTGDICPACGQRAHPIIRLRGGVDVEPSKPRGYGTLIVVAFVLLIAILNGLVPAIVRWLP